MQLHAVKRKHKLKVKEVPNVLSLWQSGVTVDFL